MIIGIVGSEGAKFDSRTEHLAKGMIFALVSDDKVTAVVSGECHLGGIDIWAKDITYKLGKRFITYPPKGLEWKYYKARNMQIVRASDKVVCITIGDYPAHYTGMKFSRCYHCNTNTHVKSGGCWTVKQADRLGKDTEVIVIR